MSLMPTCLHQNGLNSIIPRLKLRWCWELPGSNYELDVGWPCWAYWWLTSSTHPQYCLHFSFRFICFNHGDWFKSRQWWGVLTYLLAFLSDMAWMLSRFYVGSALVDRYKSFLPVLEHCLSIFPILATCIWSIISSATASLPSSHAICSDPESIFFVMRYLHSGWAPS